MSTARFSGDEGRLVLGTRIEQEAGAGLDHRAEAQLLQPLGEAFGPRDPILGEGIEMVVVEGEGDAAVAVRRHQLQRVVEAVRSAAVGVVGEAQAHGVIPAAPAVTAAATWCASGSR